MSLLRDFPQAYADGTSAQFTTPYPHTPGTQARDAAGNIFVLCTCSSTAVSPELCVAIGPDWAIVPVAATGRGPVGVVADLTKAGNTVAPVSPFQSGTAVWVQIYGRAYVQLSTGGDSSPSDSVATLQTTAQTQFYHPTSGVATPAGGLLTTNTNVLTTSGQYRIVGMTVATDVSVGDTSVVTAVSATHTGGRCAVWLNYPVVTQLYSIPSVT